MIYVKGSYATFVMDREVPASNGFGLYSSGPFEATVSIVRQSEKHSKSLTKWRSRSRQDNNRQSHVQRDRLRLHGNQWF
jgi:hypothetical protein